jgi:uncharacterized protein with HEPN domain
MSIFHHRPQTTKWEHRVADITEAIEAVLEYTAAMSFEQSRR